MRIGRLHVNFMAGRQEHTQTKWPDADWRTNYMESDMDCDKREPGSPLNWSTSHEETLTRREIVLLHRTVSRYLIKFTVQYRTFYFEVANCTNWKWWK